MGVNPVDQKYMVLTMHGFSNANYFLTLSFISVVSSMSFWWRDVISEGKVLLKSTILSIYSLNIAKAIPTEDVEKAIYKAKNNSILLTKKNFGHYLAGLLELKKPTNVLLISTLRSIKPSVTVSIVITRSKSISRPKGACTALVVWGENMYSGFRTLRLSNIELNMFKLPEYQRGIIVGLLLSDGWLSYPSANNKFPRFGFEQTFSQSSYVWSVYWMLSHYCYSLPRFKTKTRNNIQTSSVTFATRSLPCFVEFFDCFYHNGKKVIPEHIYHLLTPVSLAHLIMGDGSVVSGGIRISTDSFTVQDVVRLINVLVIKYRLKCTLHMINNKPRIFISSKSMVLWIPIINPYIIPSMKYKLITKSNQNLLLSVPEPNLPNQKVIGLHGISSTGAIKENTAVICYIEPVKEICIKHILPPYLYSIFIGLLLSKGWANIHGKTNSKARIKFCQPYINKEYLYYVFREIHMYCEKDPYRFNSYLLKGKPVDVILISTRWMFCFIDIYSMFYIKNVKRVPCNIYDLLTPLVLAHWVMGSGIRLQGRGIKLGTNFYDIFDMVKLINVLTIKYRLRCNLQLEKDKHSIYIYHTSLNTLFMSIKPFILPSMQKKLI
jgi:hypothetical protein